MNDRHDSLWTLLSRSSRAVLAAGLMSLVALPSFAQTTPALAVPPGDPPHTAADLETLVGPIALYPDDLIGIVLPASTYPLQIVQASRFLERQGSDASLQPDDEWDNTVVALLNYPEVLALLDENIDWTWALGEAVLAQQSDVMDAIQSFRTRAYAAGNLRTDERQIVTQDEDVIEIAPADPEVIYIPYYEPERVVYVQPRPVYYYYPRPYPVYYYPYPIGYSFSYHFGTGFFWGVTSIFNIGWHNHYVHVYHHRHHLHPYYHHVYHAPYYVRRGVNININVNRVSHIWRPDEHRAARPHVGRGRVVTNREGYTDGRTRRTTTSIANAPDRPYIMREGGTRAIGRPANQTPRGTTTTDTSRRVAGSARSANRNDSSARERLEDQAVRGNAAGTRSTPARARSPERTSSETRTTTVPSTRYRSVSPDADVVRETPRQRAYSGRTRVTPQPTLRAPARAQSNIPAAPQARSVAPQSQGRVTQAPRSVTPSRSAPQRQPAQVRRQSAAPPATFTAPRAQSTPRATHQSATRAESARIRQSGRARTR